MNKDNRRMDSTELREKIISFLKEHKSGTLATVFNSRPRCSPIQYFLGADMDIYIVSAGGDKFRAIEQNSEVCLLVNTEYINFKKIKGVQIFGKASTSLTNRTLFDEALKYTSEPYMFEMNRDSLKVIKIVPDEIIYLDAIETGDRTKQILRNDQVTIKEDKLTPVH